MRYVPKKPVQRHQGANTEGRFFQKVADIYSPQILTPSETSDLSTCLTSVTISFWPNLKPI